MCMYFSRLFENIGFYYNIDLKDETLLHSIKYEMDKINDLLESCQQIAPILSEFNLSSPIWLKV